MHISIEQQTKILANKQTTGARITPKQPNPPPALTPLIPINHKQISHNNRQIIAKSKTEINRNI